MNSSPKILLVAWETSWMGIARLPQSLQQAGFKVGLLCKDESFLAKTRFRDFCALWHPCIIAGSVLQQFERVIVDWDPDWLIPADEAMTAFFGRLKKSPGQMTKRLNDLLEKSLPHWEPLLQAGSKYQTLQCAQRLGVRTPEFRVVGGVNDALEFGRESGFPFLFKRAVSWGGEGVIMVNSAADVTQHWQRMQPKYSGWKRRAYYWRDVLKARVIPTKWRHADTVITANQYIPGTPVLCLGVAWQGQYLALLTARKITTYPTALSPSAVMEFMSVPEIEAAAQKMAAAWNWTGFLGFDFMLDVDGRAWMIESNPRPVPVAHLGQLVGVNLCAALYRQMLGLPQIAAKQQNGLRVAHFPREMARDPDSIHLREATVDRPDDDPPLLAALTEWYERNKQRA